MKHTTKLFIGIILLLICCSYNAMAWTLKFRAVDALGNADTLIIEYKESATNGFDSELGEVNLYGVPPEKDIDVRIIQRTDANYYRKYEPEEKYPDGRIVPYWLVPFDNVNIGDTIPDFLWYFMLPGGPRPDYYRWDNIFPSSKENIDLKTNYVWALFYAWDLTLKITAKHFPVTFYLCDVYGRSGVGTLGIRSLYDAEKKWQSVNNWPPAIVYHNSSKITLVDSRANDYIFVLKAEYTSNILTSKGNKTLYPNPAENYVVLDDVLEGNRFILVTSDGKIINEFVVTNVPFTLDISTLPTGNYYIINPNKPEYYSFIKQ